MKLNDILNEADNAHGISTEDMEHVFKALDKRQPMERMEVKALAKDLADAGEFSRNVNSAEFVVNRMHVLVHGIAPYGETENRAEKLFNASGPLVAFLKGKGYDVDENLKNAREELKNRPVTMKRDHAKQLMVQHWNDVKRELKPKQAKAITAAREHIIDYIAGGMKPVEAFSKVL